MIALSLCLTSMARASGEAELARAERLVDALRYTEAARALEAARAVHGNDRATLLRILELQGIVAASLGRVDQARSAFRLLIVLDPGRTMKGRYSPKVTAPFYEAKGWATEHGVLRFLAEPPEIVGERVRAVRARVETDPLKVARRVRFHLQEGEAAPRTLEVPLEERVARVEVERAPVRWWAELLGNREEVLALVGSEEAPVVWPPPGSGQASSVIPEKERPVISWAWPQVSLPDRRTLSYVALGGAGVALTGGGIFGLRSLDARARIRNAARDEQGRVIGLTQREAMALDARARSDAVAANVFFGAAGVLAATGAVLWWTSGQPPQVAVVPMGQGQGVALTGMLP